MSAERMKALKALVMNSDDKIKLFCINADERGMIDQQTLAWFHQRFCELSNLLLDKESDVPFGCIPTFNLFGDIFQLGAICDRNVYDIILKSTSPLDALGHTVYKNFYDVVVLDGIMRQKPDQINLLQRLDNIRSGNVTYQDWEQINSRVLNDLPEMEKIKFKNNSNAICLTETWEEAKKYNKEILNSMCIDGQQRVACAEIPCTGHGKHHLAEKDSMGQIPNMCIVATGCRVILTKITHQIWIK